MKSKATIDLRMLGSWTADEAAQELTEWMDTPSGYGAAYWLLKTSGHNLLIVKAQPLPENSDKTPVLYTLRHSAGIWQGAIDNAMGIAAEAARLWRQHTFTRMNEKLEEGGTSKSVYEWGRRRLDYANAGADKFIKAGQVHAELVHRAMAIAKIDSGATICYEHELDAQMRYLAFDDGVYDLDEHRPVDGDTGKQLLCTRTLGYPMSAMPASPDEMHPDAQLMVSHGAMDDELLDYLHECLAWSIRGAPDKAYYLLIDAIQGTDEGDAGKTAKLHAFQHMLGGHAQQISLDAMRGVKDGSAGRATPELAPLCRHRMVWTDEAAQGSINKERFKTITGLTDITYRLLYGNMMQQTATASIFGTANDRLRMDMDTAARNRYKPIPMPKLPPERIVKDLHKRFEAVNDPGGFRRASLLAYFLGILKGLDGKPPDTPQAVKNLAAAHQTESQGAAGEWILEHLEVTDLDGDRISTKEIWLVCKEMTPAMDKWMDQGKLTKAVSNILQLPTGKVRINGKNPNGFKGLRFSEEAAAVALTLAGGKQSAM